MIQIHLSKNEVKNSIKTKELSDYLLGKGHDISVNKESVIGAKVDLLTGIAIATLTVNSLALMYPIIKDLQNWVRPRRYTISITDGKTTGTINNLTEDEYIQLVEQLNMNNTKIEVSN